MEIIVNSNYNHDFTEEMKKFVDTKAGVKGLVDSGMVKLPIIFIQPPKPVLKPASNSTSVSLTVPVIDLKGVDDEHRRREIVNEINEAAEKWGVFHLINHGVPTDVIDDVLEGVKEFHEQPLDVKNEFFQRDVKQLVKFRTSAQANQPTVASWKDMLTCLYRDQQLGEEELPQVCRKTINEYTKHIFQLKDTLSQLLSEALGICPDYLAKIECMKSMTVIGNYYPSCPEPDLALGSNDHTDPYFLTILAQDNIGGLQVLHDNQRIDVPCVKGSLIVNLGDMMQIISNDKYKSVMHRVLAGPTTRISVACLISPSSCKMDTLYGPLKEIIDDDNPPVYRHVSASEYVAHYLARRGQVAISKFKLEK
jgi:isopenicillin N synthase-like dioxygenase